MPTTTTTARTHEVAIFLPDHPRRYWRWLLPALERDAKKGWELTTFNFDAAGGSEIGGGIQLVLTNSNRNAPTPSVCELNLIEVLGESPSSVVVSNPTIEYEAFHLTLADIHGAYEDGTFDRDSSDGWQLVGHAIDPALFDAEEPATTKYLVILKRWASEHYELPVSRLAKSAMVNYGGGSPRTATHCAGFASVHSFFVTYQGLVEEQDANDVEALINSPFQEIREMGVIEPSPGLRHRGKDD